MVLASCLSAAVVAALLAPPGFAWREVRLPPGAAAWALAVSPDGSRLAVAGDGVVHVVSAADGAPVTRIRLPAVERADRPLFGRERTRLAFTPDGKVLATAVVGDAVARFWDARTGKQVRELTLPEQPNVRGATGRFLDFAPGAARVVARAPGGRAGLLEVLDADGAPERQIQLDSVAAGVAVGPGVVAVPSPAGLGTWDIATGERLIPAPARVGVDWAGPGPRRAADDYPVAVLSVDARLVVATAARLRPRPAPDTFRIPGLASDPPPEPLMVFRVRQATPDPAGRVPNPGRSPAVVATPDGRCVVVAGPGRFGVFDLIRDGYRPEFKAPARDCTAVAADPSGATLVVAADSSPGRADDGGVSVYFAPLPKLPPPVPEKGDWSAADEQFLWDAAPSRNEFRREYAVSSLLARPDGAAAVAAARVRPVPPAEVARLEALVAKLDDDSADARDAAAKALAGSAHAFEPMLAAAHADAPAGERKNRLGTVLAKAKVTPAPPELDGALRHVELVERLGTPAAKALLARLADGARGARVTDAAAAAYRRLADR